MTTTKTPLIPPIVLERSPETDALSLDEAPPPDDDPDTSRLLPARKRRQHRVRVQGRLAVVRSVSTADLKAGDGEAAPGRRSADDERETAVRDRQLRGYGIGGAGNIREFFCRGVFSGWLGNVLGDFGAYVVWMVLISHRQAYGGVWFESRERDEVVESTAHHGQDEREKTQGGSIGTANCGIISCSRPRVCGRVCRCSCTSCACPSRTYPQTHLLLALRSWLPSPDSHPRDIAPIPNPSSPPC